MINTYDVFISYKSDTDKEVANSLYQAFKGQGLSVWWDENLRVGDDWEKRIDHILSSVSTVVVLWSKDSVASKWVRYEASVGKIRKTLLNVQIDTTEVPVIFNTIQAANLAEWNKSEKHYEFNELVKRIKYIRYKKKRSSFVKWSGWIIYSSILIYAMNLIYQHYDGKSKKVIEQPITKSKAIDSSRMLYTLLDTSIKKLPNRKSEISKGIKCGTKLLYTGEEKLYFQVKHNNYKGYIPKDYVTEKEYTRGDCRSREKEKVKPDDIYGIWILLDEKTKKVLSKYEFFSYVKKDKTILWDGLYNGEFTRISKVGNSYEMLKSRPITWNLEEDLNTITLDLWTDIDEKKGHRMKWTVNWLMREHRSEGMRFFSEVCRVR